ncbi:MAG TPA: hypothetical protein PJ982_13055 [Lacipirellulaceae bacterium]|nr:hypothetical protein [Lacipirellulaceae bacterium]
MLGGARPSPGQTYLDRPGFENLEARGIQRFVVGQPSFDCAPIINEYLANMGEGLNQRNRGVFIPAGQ